MKRCAAEWRVLRFKVKRFRFYVEAGELGVRCVTRGQARFAAALLVGRILPIEQVNTHALEFVSRLYQVKFWAPDPEDTRRMILIRRLWADDDTTARHLAWHWELQRREHMAALKHGGGKLERPYSAKDVPF